MLACDSLRNFDYVFKRSQSGVRIVQTEVSFKNLTCCSKKYGGCLHAHIPFGSFPHFGECFFLVCRRLGGRIVSADRLKCLPRSGSFFCGGGLLPSVGPPTQPELKFLLRSGVTWRDGVEGPSDIAHLSVFDSHNDRLYVDERNRGWSAGRSRQAPSAAREYRTVS